MGYLELYRDFHEFHMKWKNDKNLLEKWEIVVDEGESIARRYKNSKFAIDLMLSIFDELKRNAVMQE